MKYVPHKHHRRSIRLRGYDYSRAGTYFVTICTHNRKCLFGNIVGGEMRLNEAGRIAHQCWNDIPCHFPHAIIDEFIVMPNHIHGIVFLNNHAITNGGTVGANDGGTVGAKNFSPLQRQSQRGHTVGPSKTIGSIVRGFKIGVTKWMRQNTPAHHVWQRNYWEHIVRDERELVRIRRYIIDNPAKWDMDRENPDAVDRRGTARRAHSANVKKNFEVVEI